MEYCTSGFNFVNRLSNRQTAHLCASKRKFEIQNYQISVPFVFAVAAIRGTSPTVVSSSSFMTCTLGLQLANSTSDVDDDFSTD